MATRFNGGIIGVRNSTTGGASGLATGRFSSNEVLLSVKDNAWPLWQAPTFNYLFTWGNNGVGRLGLDDTTTRSSPVQVGLQKNWASVAAGGYASAAVKTNGQLWTWGGNSTGRLGLNDTVDRSSPVQVGALTNWATPTRGSGNTFCIKTDGTLWAWGQGAYGANGQNNTQYRSSPVQIGTSTTWTAVAAGGSWCFAVDGGKLFAWGKGTSAAVDTGHLGLGDLVSRSSPTQVGALTTWAQPATNVRSIGFVLCTKTDGTLWSWGVNTVPYFGLVYGNLGHNDTISRSSPVQVGTLTNWATPSVGDTHSVCVKTDGTLWTWGRNYNSALGLLDTINRSSPTQVGALTNWDTPTAGHNFTLCTKTDGTLWSWGNGSYGSLGQAYMGTRSSPVQVGSLTTWPVGSLNRSKISVGFDFAIAIKTP